MIPDWSNFPVLLRSIYALARERMPIDYCRMIGKGFNLKELYLSMFNLGDTLISYVNSVSQTWSSSKESRVIKETNIER